MPPPCFSALQGAIATEKSVHEFRIDFFQLVLRGGKMAFWELLHKPPYCSEHFLRDFISSGRHPLKIKAEGSRYETYVCRAGADAVTWTKDDTTHRI
jgi:hypothetical protein